MSIYDIARPEIVAMQAYSSARREADSGDIWLNANESPFNCDKGFNRYPEPQPRDLLQRLSDIYQVDTSQLLISRGSDEAIDILIRTFCQANRDAILTTPPSYGMYDISATIQGVSVEKAELHYKNSFAFDLDLIIKKSTDKVKLIFLCSPNNPTGNIIARDDIVYLCEHFKDQAIIVVDEAYIEFSQYPSMAKDVQQYPNLVVLRTLSKAYGLAGLRCGSLLAHEDMINLLLKVLPPYPIAKPVSEAAFNALGDDNLKQILENIELIKTQRQRLLSYLQSLDYVETLWPSEANFILVKFKNTNQILAHCDKAGIVMRNRSKEHQLDRCVRITVGTEQENERLIEVLGSVT